MIKNDLRRIIIHGCKRRVAYKETSDSCRIYDCDDLIRIDDFDDLMIVKGSKIKFASFYSDDIDEVL